MSFSKLIEEKGFQIDFRFRNAPPRPPVGPTFVKLSLHGALQNASHYQPMNAVEVNYTWKLHSEPDLGVPLAPSAMDLQSYRAPATTASTTEFSSDDLALLDWKGSMGDTAAEELKKRRDRVRAAARLALAGKTPLPDANTISAPPSSTPSSSNPFAKSSANKKEFSRVLDETMQSWMKKTTYLSNDYSRKVHDFKSLAQTKQQVEVDLKRKQAEMAKQRSTKFISSSFSSKTTTRTLVHPRNKQLKPKWQAPLLPNVGHWGQAYTHVVMDKVPNDDKESLSRAFVANVEKKDANARMTCQFMIPKQQQQQQQDDKDEEQQQQGEVYGPIQQYDLDVIPLKEEDVPHVNFCIWINHEKHEATYLPISSRVQLSSGRPSSKKQTYQLAISRRGLNNDEREDIRQRMAEVDLDIANGTTTQPGEAQQQPQVDHDDDGHDEEEEDEDHDHGMSNDTIMAGEE